MVSALIAGALAPGALHALPTRPNFRAVALPFPMGILAGVAGVLTLGVMAVWDRIADGEDGNFLVLFGAIDRVAGQLVPNLPIQYAALFLGVSFLGLLDDLLDADPRGWRGHGRAVLRGGFSTGAFKAVGTLALAFAVLAGPGFSTPKLLLATLVIALTTNLFNLFDLRPGRSWKAFILLAGGLLAASGDWEVLRIVGPFAGALLVLGFLDLRERCMLGDTGSNLLGALAGVLLVTTLGTAGQAVAAVVLLAITIFGEFASISTSIERVPPLRFLDSLGRKETDA